MNFKDRWYIMIKTTPEHIKQMENIHLNICNEYGYKPVPISLNDRINNTIGNCIYHINGNKEIEISTKFIECNNWRIDVLTALIKHEIAHLKHPNHGPGFTRECQRMGLPYNHTWKIFDDLKESDKKYTAICPSCGHKHQLARKTKHMNRESCGHCSKVYDESKKLVYIKNW